jgi:hypothetical protein
MHSYWDEEKNISAFFIALWVHCHYCIWVLFKRELMICQFKLECPVIGKNQKQSVAGYHDTTYTYFLGTSIQ